MTKNLVTGLVSFVKLPSVWSYIDLFMKIKLFWRFFIRIVYHIVSALLHSSSSLARTIVNGWRLLLWRYTRFVRSSSEREKIWLFLPMKNTSKNWKSFAYIFVYLKCFPWETSSRINWRILLKKFCAYFISNASSFWKNEREIRRLW